MPRLTALILALLLALSVGLGSAAHAMESAGPLELPQSLVTWHADGDGDHVPADADKGYPHHHFSCHGDHQLGVAAAGEPMAFVDSMRADVRAGDQAALTPIPTDPALRPPQA